MFRYGWISDSRNMSRFGVAQRQSPQQLACRLCNQIFMGSRALVHHLESHVTEDGNISTRQDEIKFTFHHREGNDSSNQLQSNFALPAPVQEIRQSVQNSSYYSPVQNPAVPERHHISTGRFDVPSPQLQTTSRLRPPVRSDFIKPYIDQLDKPIQETVPVVLIGLDYDDEKKLDLTLKL